MPCQEDEMYVDVNLRFFPFFPLAGAWEAFCAWTGVIGRLSLFPKQSAHCEASEDL